MMNSCSRPVLLFLMIVVAFPLATTADAQESDQQAILVTGATSGIGLKITEHLAAAGHFVYAGARKDADMARLNAMDNVMAVRLDVTDQGQIDAAVATITVEGRGLHGLVNNAGVAIFGPMVDVTEEDFHWQMDVNVYGPFRVTKAFAPLIVESQGRIVTIGSISGVATPGGLGPYSMTKHAMEAFTDALAAEMVEDGVGVSVVEPGNYKSRISARAYDRLKASLEKQGREPREWEKEFLDGGPSDRSQYKEPDEVAEATLRALFDEEPSRRYMIVPAEGEANWALSAAVREVVELNANQPFAYDRETLIEMLDEELAKVAK